MAGILRLGAHLFSKVVGARLPPDLELIAMAYPASEMLSGLIGE